MIKTKVLGDKIPKQNKHYTCISSVTINSVMKVEKKNYLQVYLEECKCKMKKTKMNKFISTELESDSESDSKSESKSDTKLMGKLESASDSA